MQRRDVGNEVIVALAAIGMLALALTFGVILTLSRTVSTPSATGTSVAGIGTQAATLPATGAATKKATASTGTTASAATTAATGAATTKATASTATTASLANGATATTASAATAPATAPATAVANSITSTTAPASTTKTAAVTVSGVGQVTTAAATTTPSRTSTATNTTVAISTRTQPATSTFTATATKLPSNTPSATSTATAVPSNTSTATNTPTATDTPSETSTATPTSSPTNTPTRTATATYLPTYPFPDTATAQVVANAPPTSTGCVARAGWLSYVVQQGDTLFSISRRAGISLQEIQQANCIANANTIYVGEVIFVPSAIPVGVVILPTGTVVSIVNANAAVCPNLNAQIIGPTSETNVSGIVILYGSANVRNFSYYVIEYKPDINPDWVSFGKNFTAVTNGVLGRFDPNPSQLPNGGYQLRLRVVDGTGVSATPCVIHITLSR